MDFGSELDCCQRVVLDAAHDHGADRYVLYRRRGYSPALAYRYALAWSINMSAQTRRRISHGTGATSKDA